MKDAIVMWRDTRMVVLAALIGATYAAVMIPFKIFVFIPGFTEFRPGVVIPVVFSLMFGPAAAWGAGMGNVIGDIVGGQFGPGTAFGFVGNFLLGYVPYKVWGRMGVLSSKGEPTVGRGWIGEYVLASFLASGACATFIAWGLDTIGAVPFNMLSNFIFGPNVVMSGLLGPPLLAALYPRVEKWGLLYRDMMLPVERPIRGRWVFVMFLFAGIASGYYIGNAFYFGLSEPLAGRLGLALGVAPSVVVIFLAVGLLDVSWRRKACAPPIQRRPFRTGDRPSPQLETGREFLNVKGLRFTYRGGKRPALDNVDFSLTRGECAYVMGRSGAGKSSLCFSLRGLIPESCPGDFQGEILLGGESISGRRVRELAHRIGIVFQDFESQLFCTTVELEVAFTPQNLGLPREEIGKRVARCLELVGLGGFDRRDPTTLSGGEKQRLALAAVLAGEPELLILDEVTSDLDPAGKGELLNVIAGIYGGRQTMLATTHAYEEASRANVILILDEGRVAARGCPGEIICKPRMMEKHGVQAQEINLLAENESLAPVAPQGNPATLFGQISRRFKASRFAEIERKEREREKSCGQPIIEVEGLTCSPEGNKEILSGVDLSIREGEIVAIVGKNGAGKTTLIKHFNGLLRPTSGDVRVKGVSTKRSSLFELCKTVGFVFQNPDHQIFSETVRKELSFGPRNFGVGDQEIEERVAEALAAVRLEGFEEEDPLILPKGGRQKVAVASILAVRPEVLVLDEPTTGLDYEETVALMELVRSLNKKGHTVLVVTHAMWVVARYAHRAVVMSEGRIVADTTPRSLFANASLLETAGLLAPEIAVLSNRFLGKTLLTAGELGYCLEAK
jgi:cobalt transport protein ATP-binding subunit